jgi:hypothetical protein
MSGWSNQSGRVTSYKMSENEMGYRGTKSEILSAQPNRISVKAQRVDGSWLELKTSSLRCTLSGLERDYQTKIPSKQFQFRKFSFFPTILNPWFITGFSDAESCFYIGIFKDKNLKMGWRVKPHFFIILHKKDINLLDSIMKTLNIGKIYTCGKNAIKYEVHSFSELKILIDHFDNYPLISQKLNDFLIFKKCYSLIEKGDHLTKDGLLKLVSLKSSLNLGLSDNLKKAFPNFELMSKLPLTIQDIPDPFWISGFVNGEGSFNFVLNKVKKSCKVRLSINLHIRDFNLLKSISYFLKINDNLSDDLIKYIHKRERSVQLQISKFSHIEDIIIPFFESYPISGVKKLDFEDFKKGFNIIQKCKVSNISLDILELEKIISNMNLRRK